MRRYVAKPGQSSIPPSGIADEPELILSSDISITRLIDDGLVALHREIKNLLMLSTKGKLRANDARDLRDHLKLLFELKDRENESLRGFTDEQLKEEAKAALNNDDKQD